MKELLKVVGLAAVLGLTMWVFLAILAWEEILGYLRRLLFCLQIVPSRVRLALLQRKLTRVLRRETARAIIDAVRLASEAARK